MAFTTMGSCATIEELNKMRLKEIKCNLIGDIVKDLEIIKEINKKYIPYLEKIKM